MASFRHVVCDRLQNHSRHVFLGVALGVCEEQMKLRFAQPWKAAVALQRPHHTGKNPINFAKGVAVIDELDERVGYEIAQVAHDTAFICSPVYRSGG
jgi:hypothetical protein